MAEILPGWTPELERSFKEVLFRFLEEVHSTKAALYLRGPDGGFLLATQYGFGRREMVPTRHESRAPLVLRALEGRGKPIALNNQNAAPDLHELFQRAGTTRMMVVPVFGNARLVGFADVRDKGQKRPFDDEDLATAVAISEDLLRLIEMTTLVAEVRTKKRRPGPAKGTVPSRPFETGAEAVLDEIGLEQMHRAVCEQMSRQSKLAATALTIATKEHVGARLIVASGAREDDCSPILHHQAEAMRVRGLNPPPPDAWVVRVEAAPCRIEEHGSRVIATKVALEREDWALVLSVVGLAASDELQHAVNGLARRATELCANAQRRFARRQMSLKLLRHQGRRLKELEIHSMAVSQLAWATAQELGCGLDLAEDVALAGLLHDVGMRDLDYDQNYRHPSPGPDEYRIFEKHVDVGAKILGDNGLGGLGEAVRHHHERWDGQGYPDRLAGNAIPVLARVVHVAEVFDVLTSSGSYRRQVSRERALAVIKSEAGRQFDPAVVGALSAVIQRSVAAEEKGQPPDHD